MDSDIQHICNSKLSRCCLTQLKISTRLYACCLGFDILLVIYDEIARSLFILRNILINLVGCNLSYSALTME